MKIKYRKNRSFAFVALMGLSVALLAGLLGLMLGLARRANAQSPGVAVGASPATIAANGLATTTITVTAAGAPDGSVVTITTSAGYLGNWRQIYTGTTSGGVVNTILTSAPSSVTAAIALTATVSGESGRGSVTFQAASCRDNLWGWSEYSSNPVFDPVQTVYYPTVIYQADAFGKKLGDVISASLPYTYTVTPYYKMWTARSNANRGLQFAYSDDGLNWHQFNDGAQLPGLALNGYHSQVLYDAGAFGGSGYLYRIWYWDPDQPLTSINAFRTARSANGISWVNDQALTQSATMPLVSGVDGTYWYHTYGPAAVLYNPVGPSTPDSAHPLNNRYVMYYSASGEGFAPDGNAEATGLAYSADGITWTRYGVEPVLSVGPAGAWDYKYAVAYNTVLRGPDGFYHMWYSGGSGRVDQGIGYAVSADGIHWSKSLNNPIFHVSDGVPTRTSRTYTPLVLYDTNGFGGHGPAAPYKMWFTGDNGSNRTIHFATLHSAVILSYISGNGQIGNSGGVLTNPFLVRTANTCDDPAAGAPVSFSITGWPDTATISGTLSVTNTVTVANGQAVSTLTLGDADGVYTVTVQSAGLFGSPRVFTATARSVRNLYLPLVLKSNVSAPDLVVERIIATRNSVQVVIANRGNAPVVDEFWVDAYINPNPAPTHVNQIWHQLGSQGLVWGVTPPALPMAPGGVLTLNLGAYYTPTLSHIVWPLPAGTLVYAHVDSWNQATTWGAVLESHEVTGAAYNNIAGTVSTFGTPSALSPSPDRAAQPASPGDLPSRLSRRLRAFEKVK